MEDINSYIVKLKASDGKIFEIEENCLKRVELFKDNLFKPNEEINIEEVNSKELNKIIEYLKHYQYQEPKIIPTPLLDSDLKTVLSEWDYNYISSLSLEECIDLVNAVNYLGIYELIHLTSARLSSEMINCSIEEARAKFGIESEI